MSYIFKCKKDNSMRTLALSYRVVPQTYYYLFLALSRKILPSLDRESVWGHVLFLPRGWDVISSLRDCIGGSPGRGAGLGRSCTP